MKGRDDTIFALSSGPGRAAIAVLRVSGPDVVSVINGMSGRLPRARHAVRRMLTDPRSGEKLDDAIVLFFAGPESATGQDVAEFHVHGGRAVVRAVIDAISAIPGCRPAEPGEFAHRAFINGKMDLTAAEGLADLIDSETEAQRRQAIRQAGGELAALYSGWRTRLIECQALVESAIDFSDEGDVAVDAYQMASVRARPLADEIATHLALAGRAEIIRTGFRVVIAGPANAGKSTLLNALARRDAAIVSAEAGTTRDAIEIHLDLDGLPFVLTDTAGLRDTANLIELAGIERTRRHARAADLVLWLSDVTDPVSPPVDLVDPGTPLLEVLNKADRLTSPPLGETLAIAAARGRGLDKLTDRLVDAVRDRLGSGDDLVPATARQSFHLSKATEHLQNFLHSPPLDIELRAEDLRLAADCLGRLTGRVDPEDVLDQIFSRFCIGK